MCNLSRLLIDLKCAVRNVSFKSLLKSPIIFVAQIPICNYKLLTGCVHLYIMITHLLFVNLFKIISLTVLHNSNCQMEFVVFK